MPSPQKPLFLARRAYRRRRMMDAGRLLPLLGGLLLLAPVLWIPAATHRTLNTSAWAVYLFLVWIALIMASAALARGLRPAMSEEEAALGAGADDPAEPER